MTNLLECDEEREAPKMSKFASQRLRHMFWQVAFGLAVCGLAVAVAPFSESLAVFAVIFAYLIFSRA